jgi:AcrR family transcriptional regulator
MPRARAAGNSKPKGEMTRDKLLRAAIAEFAENGYSGARVDAICRAAGANPRMLYHHFTDKDGLYVAVLEAVIGDLRREELKLDVDHVEPMDGMMQLFNFIHGHFGAHPELIKLLSGENLLRARFLRRSTATPIVSSPLIEIVTRLLKRGQKSGVIRRGVDPLHLYVMMVGLSYFHRSNAYTLSIIFRTELTSRSWQDHHERAAREMLARYLAV